MRTAHYHRKRRFREASLSEIVLMHHKASVIATKADVVREQVIMAADFFTLLAFHIVRREFCVCVNFCSKLYDLISLSLSSKYILSSI